MPKHSTLSLSASSEAVLGLLAQMIRAARLERGMSQLELADRVGVSRHTVMVIEKADDRVAIGAVLECAAVLGIPLLAEDKEGLNKLAGAVANLTQLLPVRGGKRKVELDDNF